MIKKWIVARDTRFYLESFVHASELAVLGCTWMLHKKYDVLQTTHLQ